MGRLCIIASLTAALLVGARLDAQSIKGIVVDASTVRPIADALVTLVDPVGQDIFPAARTDSAGGFVLHAGASGSYRVRVVRIGYQPLTSAVFPLGLSEIVSVRMPLATVPQRVTAVEVIGRRQLTLSELNSPLGFDVRRSKGLGVGIGAEALKHFGPQDLLSVFESHELPSVTVNKAPGGDTLAITRCDSGTDIYLDGMKVSTGTAGAHDGAQKALSMIAMYHADQLHGVEVYNAIQIPPPSLGGLFGEPAGGMPAPNSRGGLPAPKCVVAVWTEAYSRRAADRASALLRAPEVGTGQVLRGTVLDHETRTPIPDVVVTLQTETGHELEKAVRTDSSGAFVVRSGRIGRMRLYAQRIGYLPAKTASFPVRGNDVVTFELEMSVTVQVLAPLTIVAKATPANVRLYSFAGFEFRRQRALGGQFFTKEDIENRGAMSLGSVVRGMAGVVVSGAGSEEAISFRRALGGLLNGKGCGPTYYLDGVQFAPERTVTTLGDTVYAVPQTLTFLDVTTIEGVEVYSGPANVPGEFLNSNSACGVIVVWTRRSGT
jgi:hypothetical protein